jgi:hypothetical protein
MFAARIDYYPWGEMPFNPKPLAESGLDRGFWHEGMASHMSGAIYGWWNNNNHNNTSNNTVVVNGPSSLTTNADVAAPTALRPVGHSGIWILG